MIFVGHLCLFAAFVASGYAAFAGLAERRHGEREAGRSGDLAGIAAVAALSVVVAVLAWALLVKDFRLAYVADYTSRQLPWQYCLSALWVGQAGSLLVWAWMLGSLTLAYRYMPGSRASSLRRPAFGILMACLCFLVAVMVFAADPLEPSISSRPVERGLSPLLQHPAMLIHPPIVFLGYAAWGIPFALAAAALLRGQLDAHWARQARSWSLFAWAALGAGILWGALWAYEELGWGGYWAWDPVENGSLMPWLTGTALIHFLMAWQHCGVWKKTALSLAVATFGLCNFATFLTRSGIFSSLHAFSQSPIGWMFLILMLVLCVTGVVLVELRRKKLLPDRPIVHLWSREAMVSISGLALLLLAVVALVGTLSLPLSSYLLGRKIMVGAAFYNNVLIPTGLLLLVTTAVAPLLRWSRPPTARQRKALLASAVVGAVAASLAFSFGVRHPIELGVAGLAAGAVAALAGALCLDAAQRSSDTFLLAVLKVLKNRRRQYAGFLIHLGFVCIAIGVAGSSLGTQRHEVVMQEGETTIWAGHSIRLVRLIQRELPDRAIAEAELEISRPEGGTFTLLPAQHLHRLQNEWTTEVAIHSTWSGDFFTIARVGEGPGRAGLTLIRNPMMRWLWFGGCIFGFGALVGLVPAGRRSLPPPAPKFLAGLKRRQTVH
jgi:cytochrome c-type biogenesis protein CcmF